MKRKTEYKDKPYNRCLQCHHRMEKRCDGPRTSAMKLERWCEFMRDMKIANGLTNAEVSERSGVSIKTIERIMAINCTNDIMRETCRLIEDAIIGSSNQYPCYIAFEESVPAADQTSELQIVRAEAQQKIDFLKQQVERLQRENDNLWEENKRKSRLVDTLIEKQNN